MSSWKLEEAPGSRKDSGRKVPRELALRVLGRVLGENEALDEVLQQVSGEVEPSERGWLQDVCSGTLRWKGRLELALDSLALRKKPSGWLRRVLLLAAYQLVVQERTARGRVVNETVELIKRKEGEAPARFANALLRRISEQADDWRTAGFPKGQDVEAQARWASLPVWLWRRLVREQGVERASAFAEATLERPSTWLRVQNADAATHFPNATAGETPGAIRLGEGQLPPGPVNQWPGFTEGAFLVQDVSSQVLVSALVDELKKAGVWTGEKNTLRALDLCAAPGGKSVGLSWSGFQVVASDASLERLGLLRQTVSRCAAEIEVREPQDLGTARDFDVVWVDAPCTGSGILRRHPDVRWLRQEKELQALAKVQEQVLREGLERVKPGGYLMYSVCSVLEEEGVARILGLSDWKDRFEIVAEWRLWPFEGEKGDGFQGALIKLAHSSQKG